METGIGVGFGGALMALALLIQQIKLLPHVARMRVVAVVALVGVASAFVPSIFGRWAKQGVDAVIGWLGDWIGSYDAGWGQFIQVWLLPIIVLGTMAYWLGHILPKAAARVVGPVAENEFDDDDKAVVWGGAVVISLLWASAPGLLGEVLRTPIEALVSVAAPAAARLLGA